jgi:hypothetical protein
VGLLALALLAVAPPAMAAIPTKDIPIDGTPLIKALPAPFQVFHNGVPTGALGADQPQHDGRAPDLVLTLYDLSGDPAHAGPYQVPFWKEYTGTHSDVYVAWNDLAAPPESVQQDQVITTEQVASMGAEFDARIWVSDVFHFGWYKPRAPQAGLDGTRAAIMIYNIRDQAYWSDYRFYIGGYFWGGLNDELQVNAIFVDSYNWKDRIGPGSAQPYLYEGVVAHEFQHLIHNDVDGNEDSFIDEGMADLAEQFLYGTTTTASHIGEALYYHRDSLTDWKGELFDYGTSVLWQDYLWEQAGGETLRGVPAGRLAPGHADPFEDSAAKFADPGDRFVWDLIHDQANGMAGVADQVGGAATVEQLHRDWTLANLLDGKVSEAQWNYRSLTLGGPDSEGLTIQDGIKFYNAEVGGNVPPTRKNVWRRAATESWGAYYRNYYGSSPGMTMAFAGPLQDGVAAVAGLNEWYSGLGNMLDISVARQVTVTAGETLRFQTWFDIEDQWDYGYVEASTDGATWVKLPQVTTLPAATADLNGSAAWDGPGGLTGSSGGWQQAEYSFGPLSGTLWVRFRYMTDEAFNGAGWYVDDVRAGAYADDDTTAGWMDAGWLWTTGLQSNDWTVDAYVPFAKASGKAYAVVPVVWLAGQGSAGTKWLATQYTKQFRITAVMSNRPDGVFGSIGVLTVKKSR